jgi:serine/threonine protein kinase
VDQVLTRAGESNLGTEERSAILPDGTGVAGWGLRRRESLRSFAMAAALPRLTVGSRFGGDVPPFYWVERFLGAGGTAQVFAVRDEAGRLLAAKLLSDHRFPVDDAMRARFTREGEVLAGMTSPNLVRLLDMVRWNDEPVMLLEYAAGGSMADLLWHLPLPPLVVALRWMREALKGVAALHGGGVVHRDISPKNLLSRADGTVVVADFGTVRHADDETLTHDGDALGSLIYVSRQQFDDPRHATPRDDIFSCGQIAWQLLAGRRPVGNTPSLTVLRPDVSPQLVALIERMRHDDPDERPADASGALTELTELPDVLVKPALRRRGPRPLASHELSHNEWSASVRAIGARQQDKLADLGRRRGSTRVVWALALLVDRLGPLRFEDPGPSYLDRACDKMPVPSVPWLSSGSVRVDLVAEQSVALLTLTNAVTGLTLSYALRDPHVIRDMPWPTILEELHSIEEWASEERCALFCIFDAEQFTRGMPCAVCWRTTGHGVRLMRDGEAVAGGRLFRAAWCAHDTPAADPCCCICGCPFQRVTTRDEHGPYDAVGCQCPSLAFDLAFDEQPWEAGVTLDGAVAAVLFEQA